MSAAPRGYLGTLNGSMRWHKLAAFGTTALILFVGGSAYLASEGLREASTRFEDAQQIVQLSADIQVRLTAAELAHRGYLLTGDNDLLNDYDRAPTELQAMVDDLESVVMAHGGLDQLRRLDHALSETLGILGDRLELRSKAGPGVPLQRRRMEEARASMGRVLARLQEFRDAELAYSRGTLATLRSRQSATTLVIASGTLSAFFFALFAAMGLRGSLEARNRAEEERARLIGQLRQTNEELDRFAYVASHDLKAPLRGIATLVSFLEEDLGPGAGAETMQHLRLLHERAADMHRLIDQLLEYARVGRTQELVNEIDVGLLLDEVVTLLAPTEGVRIEKPDALPKVCAARVQIQQVFMNLLSNAIRHGERSDLNIAVRLADERGAWRFTIQDNGAGIPREEHEHIFELFHSRSSSGSGVGLALVRRIVEGAGGRVWVDSEPGKGAAFHFTWPKSESPRAV